MFHDKLSLLKLRSEGLTQLLAPLAPAVLRLLVQSAWTAPCSKVRRTFSRRSRPFGFKSLLSETNIKIAKTIEISMVFAILSSVRDLDVRP